MSNSVEIDALVILGNKNLNIENEYDFARMSLVRCHCLSVRCSFPCDVIITP